VVITVAAYPGVDDAFIVWQAPFIADARGFALHRRVKRGPGSAPSPEALGPADAQGFVEEMV
jgi:hypothetical protein